MTKNEPILNIVTDSWKKDFQNLDTFQKWIDKERKAFTWINQLQNAVPLSNLRTIFTNLNSIITHITNYHAQTAPTQKQNQLNQIQSKLNSIYVDQNFITTEDTEYEFIKKLQSDYSDTVAAHALITLQDTNAVGDNLGICLALEYLKGNSDTVKSAKDSLEKLKRSWAQKFSQKFKEVETEHEQKTALIDEIVENIGKQEARIIQIAKDQEEKFESLYSNLESSFSDLFEKNENTLKSIENTYSEKLALEAPVEYWTKKRKHHTNVFWFSGATSIILAAAGIAFFYSKMGTFFTESVSDAPLSKYIIAITATTVGIWLVRLFAKIAIANLHLRSDALERHTMMTAYLAMLKEGDAVKDEHREIALNALFRPSTSGLIKDDGIPNILDYIRKPKN